MKHEQQESQKAFLEGRSNTPEQVERKPEHNELSQEFTAESQTLKRMHHSCFQGSIPTNVS